MKEVFIAEFIDHHEGKHEIIFVGTTHRKAVNACNGFAKDHPEYELNRNPDNDSHWVGAGWNYNLRIHTKKVDSRTR